ncbi:MAG: translocation/assembly module TamB domain-containing protein, partial [Paludibacteraceae bacterium]|nr:translocation/assembly module TamB domain-containing protein [Paludibacteraceae bacterium]
SVISTDEMLMRQVVYLLVFNRFFTPDYLRSEESTTGFNETYSLLSSTITGQINSWLCKMTDRVAIGFNFRTDGEGTNASQEYETTFQINPINRLLINGNFGYRYNDLSNRPFFGDVDVEYMLTPEGQLRLKGYSHSVDKYSLKQANMVEGLGFTYNYDFNVGDTKKRIENRKIAKKQRQEEKEKKKAEREKRKNGNQTKQSESIENQSDKSNADFIKSDTIEQNLAKPDTIRPLVLPIDTFASENKDIAFSYLPKIE